MFNTQFGIKQNPQGQYFNAQGKQTNQFGGPTNSYMPYTGQTASQPSPYQQKSPQAPTGQQQYLSSVAPYQAQKDMKAFDTAGQIGVAGLNAMGQYGSNRDTALANQSIAAANAFGSMGNSYYNTMGQLGNYAAGLSAAGLNAGAQSASANMGSNFDMSMGGNFGTGGRSGGGGFRAAGPGNETIARGSYGGRRGGGGMGAGFQNSGSGGSSSSIQRGASAGERVGMVNQGYGFLGGLARDLNNPKNQAMSLANKMSDEFGNSRAAIMDPSIVNSLNNQVGAGYGALGGLYDRSDYGFNTGRREQAPRFQPVNSQPDYWKNPSASGPKSWFG